MFDTGSPAGTLSPVYFLTNFNFQLASSVPSVPSTAELDGVSVVVRRGRVHALATVADALVQLSLDNDRVKGENKALVGAPWAAFENVTYGGPLDRWSLPATSIRGDMDSLRVSIQAAITAPAVTGATGVLVDCVEVTSSSRLRRARRLSLSAPRTFSLLD